MCLNHWRDLTITYSDSRFYYHVSLVLFSVEVQTYRVYQIDQTQFNVIQKLEDTAAGKTT